MIYKLANAIATVSAGPTTPVHSGEGAIEALFQVQISVSGTVLLQGRADADAPWVTIDTFTASDAKLVALFEEMRVNVTVNGGIVNAWLDVASS